MIKTLKTQIGTIIFQTDTKAGRLFDIILLWLILTNVLIIVFDSIQSVHNFSPRFFKNSELFFTYIFSLEYILRIFSSKKPIKYIFSFWGLVDLISTLPMYIGWFISGNLEYFIVIRVLRLLRIFRILKLVHYINEASLLLESLKKSSRKIIVFMGVVATISLVMGTIMYTVEKNNPNFKDIPSSIYWSIVTITTVGYGDIVPKTNLGKFISTLAMLIGYSIIAIPTGIISAEIVSSKKKLISNQCKRCSSKISKEDNYCFMCGEKLEKERIS